MAKILFSPCLLCFALLFFFHSPSLAAESTTRSQEGWISAGFKNSNASFSIGAKMREMGWEIGYITGGDYSARDVLDYPVPHWDYISLGKKKIDGAYGVDFIGYAELSKKISLYGGLGIYAQEFRDIAQSTGDGLLYTQSREIDTHLAYSGGLHIYPRKDVQFGLGYHSVRGTNAQITIKF